MRNLAVPAFLASAILLAACGSNRADAAKASAPAATPSYSEGGVLTPYYGEEVVDGRIYVFGSRFTHEKFKVSHQADPLNSTTYIGRGPKRETVVVQTDKDQPQLTDRIWKQFRDRYHISG